MHNENIHVKTPEVVDVAGGTEVIKETFVAPINPVYTNRKIKK
jgi:hypothetical protein